MKFDMTPLPPPSLEKRWERIELAKIIRSYASLVIIRWSKNKKDIGTAVLMRAGNHLFAVTAEHCVDKDMRLSFPLGEGQKPRAQILKMFKRKPLDIAILELEDRPDVLACDIEQVCINLPTPTSKDTDPAAVPIFGLLAIPPIWRKPRIPNLPCPRKSSELISSK